MAEDKRMKEALSGLLEEGEYLKCPIYGTLRQGRQSWYGYFGLTDSHLLIALLEGNTQQIGWSTRIPLDIKEVLAQKKGFLGQFDIRIEFNDGMHCSLHAAKKVYGMKEQEVNLMAFLQLIERA